ncbi:MAG TPA: SET domain-containing protein-lysine N-methyltransferase [Acidimicrobiales bacterium]
MQPTSPPPGTWADDRVVVRPSPIEGRGLFAGEHIDAGTVVLRLGGRLVSSADLVSLISAAADDPDAPYVDAVTVHEDAHLVLPPGAVAHFGNHSCDPALWWAGAYEVATRRPVAAGDELTLDYGTLSGADGPAMACRCDAPACRGQVTSEDWRRPELQERYAGHWTPALQRRIDAVRADRTARLARASSLAVGAAEYADVPPEIAAAVRSVCAALPETAENQAWAGFQWRVRGRTFAHVLSVDFADGPVTVLTFRSSGAELDALRGAGHPFFRPAWGRDAVGMVLEAGLDRAQVAELVTDSYCVVAPRKLAALVHRPGD